MVLLDKTTEKSGVFKTKLGKNRCQSVAKHKLGSEIRETDIERGKKKECANFAKLRKKHRNT